MINYHQASNKINSQFYIEQLLKPENSLGTMVFEPVCLLTASKKERYQIQIVP